jgi:hypothetical protein
VWPAEVPDSVNAVAEGPAIRVFWKGAGSQDRGFYVMRTEGYGEPDQIVSPFIHASDSIDVYSWLDTSSQLNGANYYSYTVISESIGYNQSPQAEPVSVRPDVPVYIPAPQDLKLTRESDSTFLLRWQDLSGEESNNHYGYQVFQKDAKAEGGYRVLTPEPLTFETNYYVLNRVTPRDTFMVRAYNIFGNASANSEPVALHDPFFYKFGPEYVMGKSVEKGIELNWNRPLRSDVTRYHIYRITEGGEKAEIAALPVTETTFVDTKVKTGETYYYFITADAKGGLSSEASETLFITR